ncbi:DsbE family thiol:disulfide interchange protein [Marivivens aquimaris]|uniref:DsbE family thiol:disulfide interchange protein n=1 Tax=Marivivens aquimaris TaxID=2774876 RepID=UPI00187F863F|nr:DsbE family thiol:disulfide interchange protein [Marivivens aquimaris]
MAKIPVLALIPPVAFAAIAGLFLGQMYFGDGEDLPSMLIGKDAPALPDQGLTGEPVLSDDDLRSGELTLVNFWASWCPPCRAEHPVLTEMANDGIRIAGVNFRDEEGAALEYLDEEGNPYFASAFDPRGRVSIDWGVTAPPETFIVDGDGKVLFRFAGPLLGADYENRFLPELEKAMAE